MIGKLVQINSPRVQAVAKHKLGRKLTDEELQLYRELMWRVAEDAVDVVVEKIRKKDLEPKTPGSKNDQ